MSITIKDIAKLANVSTTTVSKIINNKDQNISRKTRERVKRIIEEHNYVPNRIAQSMVTKKSNTIGLIIPDVCNPFFTELARGVQDEAFKHGYNVFLGNTDESLDKELSMVQTLSEKMVEGLVIVPVINRDIDKEKAFKSRIPMVAIDRNASYANIIANIMTDNFSGSYQAVKYLISLGHKDIAFISGPIDIRPSIERKNGYLTACQDAGLTSCEDNIYIGEFNADWGDKAIEEINRNYTAYFCGNDLIAAGVIKGLAKKGLRVPEDASVVGFDDIKLASYLHPELTTVQQFPYEIGLKSAKTLIDSLIDKEIKDLVLKTELIIRDSTKSMR